MNTRRDFLKGCAATVALFTLPLSSLAALQRESDADRLERLLRAGPVRNERFVLDRPINWPQTIDVTHCDFVFQPGAWNPDRGALFTYWLDTTRLTAGSRFSYNRLETAPCWPTPLQNGRLPWQIRGWNS